MCVHMYFAMYTEQVQVVHMCTTVVDHVTPTTGPGNEFILLHVELHVIKK